LALVTPATRRGIIVQGWPSFRTAITKYRDVPRAIKKVRDGEEPHQVNQENGGKPHSKRSVETRLEHSRVTDERLRLLGSERRWVPLDGDDEMKRMVRSDGVYPHLCCHTEGEKRAKELTNEKRERERERERELSLDDAGNEMREE
jgi:hypothetical protein